ncbi:Arginase/deacetylase [Cubamyces sp. BRFM 1775]|nr:Arginase/deacetylase [Cubamyces sp. BRFM 1775]
MRVFYDPECLRHNPQHEILSGRLVPYFESPSRLESIKNTLLGIGSFVFLPTEQEWPHGILSYIIAVHTEDYVDHLNTIYNDWVADGGDKSAVLPETFLHHRLRAPASSSNPNLLSPIARAGIYCFDLSCPITENTFHAAIAAAQVTLTAARALADDHTTPANRGTFALVRPPGHHAQDGLCGGYCFLNNAAIAAKYLLQHRGWGNVAILDIDYHHGNGTQQIFYEDPRVLYVSLHAADDYPYFTGSADERGAGPGFGFNHNFPLARKNTTDDAYCETLQQAAELIRQSGEIEYLIVSLGVDTYQEDPIGGFLLTQRCYPRIGRIIASLGKSTLFVMEGGYHLETLGDNVASVLLGFEQAVV